MEGAPFRQGNKHNFSQDGTEIAEVKNKGGKKMKKRRSTKVPVKPLGPGGVVMIPSEVKETPDPSRDK